MVVPSDGRSVAGWVADADLASAALGGLSVAVADGAGHSLALCAVEEDGSFDCPLIPPQEPGSVLRVTIHDQQGQASPPVEVVVVGGRPPTPSPTKPPSPTGSSTAPPAGDSALAFTGADLTWALVALMAILLPLGAATARRRPRR
ncbi:MAG: Ig-like domain-containing protein, partial [Bifidobacteriaceae bacterium]|nr:Ig-like domain-containing protein [Bifidobacteriaceae bacterium]